MKAASKNCRTCGSLFTKPPKISWRQWDDRVACSVSCGQQVAMGQRLAARVAVSAGGCWLWTGPKDKDGYGCMVTRRNGVARNVRSHRAAYEEAHGRIPPSLIVMHSCDNPGCINPAHLSVGTHADNVADMMAKGRKRNQYGPCGHAR